MATRWSSWSTTWRSFAPSTRGDRPLPRQGPIGAGRSLRGRQDRPRARQPRPRRSRCSRWPPAARARAFTGAVEHPSGRRDRLVSLGQNARSTPATYSGAWDHIRRLFADSPAARRRRWNPGHFSFNTKAGQCPTCRGLGNIDLDVQYLPDINLICPTCRGARFNDETLNVRVESLTVADILGLTVNETLHRFGRQPAIERALQPNIDVGLGYLRLGEPTPSLSGGEAQRLRIASRLRRSQRDVLYTFDEPSTGLHPLGIRTLLAVFDRLLEDGATIVLIDHDLDLLAAADHTIDMGPGGGPAGGRIVAQGTPDEVAADPRSVTGPWLAVRRNSTEPPGLSGPAEGQPAAETAASQG